jgi:ribosomal protein S27E
MSDAPIDQQSYAFGVRVVQIEDLRVARGLTRRPVSSCRHKRLVYDDKERRVWCSDCETEVEAFDAFVGLVEVFDGGIKKLQRGSEELAIAEKFQLRTRAAKVMDEAWRSRTMAPLCPHCMEAILPSDVAGGVATASKHIVEAKRKRGKGGKA